MTLTSAGPPGVDASAARTLVVRLRHEPENDCWRGHAICVQTGETMTISLVLNDDNVAQLAVALQRLLGKPSDVSSTMTD